MREKLPLNYNLAYKRLSSLTKKLKADPEKFRRYDEVIQQQEMDGKIERVDSRPPQGSAYYLPHHCVVKENRETTKFRIVYDGSSGKPSINDCLDRGENLIPLMFDVLLQSRVHKVPLTSDIREAFHNVGLNPEFRDFFRFLWYIRSAGNQLSI